MSEQPADSEPTTDEPVKQRTRMRDRVFGIRGLVAVALAGVLLGGIGGTAIGFAADDGGGDHGPARFGRPFADDEGHPGPDGGFRPPGEPGQGPPTTAPDEEVQPDGSGDSSGSTNS